MKKIISFVLACCILLTVSAAIVGAAESCPIEDYYSREGTHQVSKASYSSGVFAYGKYTAWYPTDMETSDEKYPLIIYCNGTSASDMASYTVELMSLMASHGFICLTNDHAMSGNGDSASAELDFFLALDSQQYSLFYGKIDRNRIGICGHSQGGTAVFNAVSEGKYSNSNMFKSACAISAPTPEFAASALQNSPYDASKVNVPTFLIAGTAADDTAICPLDKSLMANFNAINNSNVIAARVTGSAHLEIQSDSKGYINAWFQWILSGDGYAAGVFTGDNPELFRNSKWQDAVSKESSYYPDTDDSTSGGLDLPSMDKIDDIIDYIKGVIEKIITELIDRIKEIIM